jgi:predicted DNA-binding transcriptional regulator YafY
MRRADRLFRIIQLLRGRGRARTARWLAEQLEVSERTVYRDVRDLIASGTPIEGEAGVGYTLRHYDLPPLMFDADEIEALALGARVVQAFGDEDLARAAASVVSKVEPLRPARRRPRLGGSALFGPPRAGATVRSGVAHLFVVRAALGNRHKLRIRYRKEDGAESDRVVRPLGAFFWGWNWTLTAWCELRTDFRNFRLDRIVEVVATQERFEDEDGRSLRDYLRAIGPDAERLLRD